MLNKIRLRRPFSGISTRSAREIRYGIISAKQVIKKERQGPLRSKISELTYKAYIHTLLTHVQKKSRRRW